MSDLAASYKAVKDSIEERDKEAYASVKRWGSFQSYCWEKFRPVTCIDILLDRKEHIRFHKEIVLAALCAWVVEPNQKQNLHIKNAVALAVGRAYCTLEAEVLKQVPGQFELVAMALHFGKAAPLLLSHIYYPIGGLSSLLETETSEEFEQSRQKASIGIRDIARVVGVFHFIVEKQASGNDLLSPARLRAGELVRTLAYGSTYNEVEPIRWGPLSEDKRTIARYNTRLGPASAFIYAASMLRYGPSSSLLTDIIEGRFLYPRAQKILPVWFSMAAFVQKEILSKASGGSYEKYDNYTQDLTPSRFAHPITNVEDQERVEAAFTRKVRKTKKVRRS